MKYLRAVLNETLRLFPPGAKEPFLCDTARFQFLPSPVQHARNDLRDNMVRR